VVTHQLQVERRAAKAHRPKTNAIPLDYATNAKERIFTAAKEDNAQKLPDLHEIFREGWQWANEQTIKFWWRSGSR